MHAYPWFATQPAAVFQINASYLSEFSCLLWKEKRLDYSVNTVFSPAKWIDGERQSKMMDTVVFLVTGSPPNEQDFCTFGRQQWCLRTSAENLFSYCRNKPFSGPD